MSCIRTAFSQIYHPARAGMAVDAGLGFAEADRWAVALQIEQLIVEFDPHPQRSEARQAARGRDGQIQGSTPKPARALDSAVGRRAHG
jgi:hypothetical protein